MLAKKEMGPSLGGWHQDLSASNRSAAWETPPVPAQHQVCSAPLTATAGLGDVLVMRVVVLRQTGWIYAFFICFRFVSHLLWSIGPFSKHIHDLKAQAGWHLEEEKRSHEKYHHQKVKSYRQWDVKGPRICTCLLVPLLVIPQWQVEGELAEPFRWGLPNVEMHSVYFCNCNKGNEVIT